MSAAAIAPCKCGKESPYVWLYTRHDPLTGTVVWHVFCKSCRAEVVRSTKRQALVAWGHEYVVHLGITLCAVCRKPACDHIDAEYAGTTAPASVTTPRTGAGVLLDHRHATAITPKAEQKS